MALGSIEPIYETYYRIMSCGKVYTGLKMTVNRFARRPLSECNEGYLAKKRGQGLKPKSV
jgi:hypothetical protein